MSKNKKYKFNNCLCGQNKFKRIFLFKSPPGGETKFNINDKDYHREIKRCEVCGHYISFHNMDFEKLYTQEYVESKYNDMEGMKKTLEKITALPSDKSDNTGRVERVVNFVKEYFLKYNVSTPSVLDVGSGLCVFLNKLKEYNFDCTALDPDKRAAKLAEEVVKVKAICDDFFDVKNVEKYNIVTFNKVLEHVKDPVAMLSKAGSFLNPNGVVYVEVPDGEMAHQMGTEKGEFFIEHYHIFSMISLSLLARYAGFNVKLTGRLIDPSKKHTLWAFLTLKEDLYE